MDGEIRNTCRFAHGKVAEIWQNADTLSLLQQPGLVPAQGILGKAWRRSSSDGTRFDLVGWTTVEKEATAMFTASVDHAIDPEASGRARASRVKTYKTAAGPVFLRSCCSPSLVEGLKADEGLRAFARFHEREHHLLSCALEF